MNGLDDIMSGKINKCNAEKEYVEKTMNDENLLRSYKGFQLLGCSKKVIDKNKDGEIAPRLETVEVTLVHCHLVNNN